MIKVVNNLRMLPRGRSLSDDVVNQSQNNVNKHLLSRLQDEMRRMSNSGASATVTISGPVNGQVSIAVSDCDDPVLEKTLATVLQRLLG